MDYLFNRPEKALIQTGLVTETGVSITGESYSDAPSVSDQVLGAGLSCVTLKVGRIPVRIADRGFHSP